MAYMIENEVRLHDYFGAVLWDYVLREVKTANTEVGEEVIDIVRMMLGIQIAVYSIGKGSVDEKLVNGLEVSYYGLNVGERSASKVYSIVHDTVGKHFSALKVETCSHC